MSFCARIKKLVSKVSLRLRCTSNCMNNITINQVGETLEDVLKEIRHEIKNTLLITMGLTEEPEHHEKVHRTVSLIDEKLKPEFFDDVIKKNISIFKDESSHHAKRKDKEGVPQTI